MKIYERNGEKTMNSSTSEARATLDDHRPRPLLLLSGLPLPLPHELLRCSLHCSHVVLLEVLHAHQLHLGLALRLKATKQKGRRQKTSRKTMKNREREAKIIRETAQNGSKLFVSSLSTFNLAQPRRHEGQLPWRHRHHQRRLAHLLDGHVLRRVQLRGQPGGALHLPSKARRQARRRVLPPGPLVRSPLRLQRPHVEALQEEPLPQRHLGGVSAPFGQGVGRFGEGK